MAKAVATPRLYEMRSRIVQGEPHDDVVPHAVPGSVARVTIAATVADDFSGDLGAADLAAVVLAGHAGDPRASAVVYDHRPAPGEVCFTVVFDTPRAFVSRELAIAMAACCEQQRYHANRKYKCVNTLRIAAQYFSSGEAFDFAPSPRVSVYSGYTDEARRLFAGRPAARVEYLRRAPPG
jgi:hypothetical protein